jgi:hypothetical protein
VNAELPSTRFSDSIIISNCTACFVLIMPLLLILETAVRRILAICLDLNRDRNYLIPNCRFGELVIAIACLVDKDELTTFLA